MLTGLVGKLVAGAVALAILGGVGLWIDGLYDDRAALKVVTEANQSLVTERDTARREAQRNREISATAMREAKALDEKIGNLKERVKRGDACLINPDDAAALDGLFQ